ncbi:MAG: NTP transferase domain-containing protein [Aestuariibacter sp.]
MSANYRLSILLMAAGASKRFNGIKQLAMVGDSNLLQRAINQMAKLHCAQCVVVLGNAAAEIQKAIQLPLEMEVCLSADWHQGLGNSIANGCNLIHQEATHILILLADQVALTEAHYQALITQSQRHQERIVCSAYEQRMGVPAIFPGFFLPRLRALSGDKGAKAIIENESYISVSMPEAAYDIDTQEQLTNWQQAT